MCKTSSLDVELCVCTLSWETDDACHDLLATFTVCEYVVCVIVEITLYKLCIKTRQNLQILINETCSDNAEID